MIREVIKMGYILPITHHSYINYEYRMRKNKKSPHYVEKPFKIKLETEGNHFSHNDKEEVVKNHFEKTIYLPRHEKNKIIGKGHYINVAI